MFYPIKHSDNILSVFQPIDTKKKKKRLLTEVFKGNTFFAQQLYFKRNQPTNRFITK